MSIEKLRDDINAEKLWYESADLQHATSEVAPDFSQWFDAFLALLDEHETAFSGGHLQSRAATHKLAEEAIQLYGESE